MGFVHPKGTQKRETNSTLPSWHAPIEIQLHALCDERGTVSLVDGRSLIEGSSWWRRPPSGKPVRTPASAGRVEGPETALFIEFGANRFQISVAVQRVCKAVRDWIKMNPIEPRDREWRKLKMQLAEVVRDCVLGSHGYPLTSYGTHLTMDFGTHFIDLDDFVNIIGRTLEINKAAFYDRPRKNKKKRR